MSDKPKNLNLTKKLILGVAIFAALLFAYFSVRWQIGDMLAQLTPSNDPNAAEIAKISVNLAPGDPVPYWFVAVKQKEDFSSENIDNSVKMMESAVRLSPYDFRWWVELGRSYEQAEETDKAEAALKHAVSLAPEYTFPRWQLGNFYIRQGRQDEALAELTRATEKSVLYRNQVFGLVWDFFGKDAAKVEQISAKNPETQVTLAMFFALRDSPKDALRIWDGLNDEQKLKFSDTGREIAHSLERNRFVREAGEFSRQTGIDPDQLPETITNGDFEKVIPPDGDSIFNWRIFKNQPKLEIVPDSSVRHGGARSLKTIFRNYIKPDLYNIHQLVQVEPGSKYKLSFWLRTENLKSGGMPFFDVSNARNDQPIVAMTPFPIGTFDWQEVSVEFTAPTGSDGVVIKMSRQPCGEECPISGTFWMDDVTINRL